MRPSNDAAALLEFLSDFSKLDESPTTSTIKRLLANRGLDAGRDEAVGYRDDSVGRRRPQGADLDEPGAAVGAVVVEPPDRAHHLRRRFRLRIFRAVPSEFAVPLRF